MVLNSLQKSALKEIGNIGAGHAANALSQMVKHPVLISIPNIEIIYLTEFYVQLETFSDLSVAVTLDVWGDVQGKIIFILEKNSALHLIDVLLKQKTDSTKVINQFEQSIIKEVGSILSVSYLLAISKMINVTLIPSVPEFFYDQPKKIFEALLEKIEMNEKNIAIGIETEFIQAKIKIKGHFIYVPDYKGIDLIFDKLGIN
ncbi:MAG: chemotaxis protein CheC [Candidatus Margulisiibacteriota bacterium]|jgi:chemotaxis protein CheC